MDYSNHYLERSVLGHYVDWASHTTTNVLPKNGVANLLQVYQDNGNLYQYGNENPGGIFKPYGMPFIAGNAVQTEFGPLRWRVVANLTGAGDQPCVIEYSLVVGEPVIRMKVTGSAPGGTTVATSFPARTTDGSTNATHLIYGTAHHFHDSDCTRGTHLRRCGVELQQRERVDRADKVRGYYR